ncbi:hypothetical protein WKW80_19725 [Variovorax humicola]|uniref:Tli3-like domain-containing protein n=1 Tax=Variovorax humicola TaxID=1769758 RepID=A0ABU8W2G2_9BURK
MKYTRPAAVLALTAGSILLAGCSLGGMGGPYPGMPELQSAPKYEARGRPEWIPPADGGSGRPREVAPPRVLYRIDENRYFEDASEAGRFCENGSPIHYVDKARGIRSYVVNMDGASMGANFIIDAANDEYLIGPVTRGNTDCSSGGGGCGGARLPYSTDAGRTWKRVGALSPSDPVSISGSLAYSTGNRKLVSSLDLSQANLAKAEWVYLPNFTFVPRKPPLDTKFRCTTNGKE